MIEMDKSKGLTDAQVALMCAVENSSNNATTSTILWTAGAYLKWLKENS